jgi:hypothetical protein
MNIVNFTNGTVEYIKCLKMEIDCFIRQRVTDGKVVKDTGFYSVGGIRFLFF